VPRDGSEAKKQHGVKRGGKLKTLAALAGDA
jgi:hypothetical protein